jgi:signal transduction histidine kinase
METKAPGGSTAIPHQVLSAASHELRGPLGVARGYLRLLALNASLDQRTAKSIADASRATDRMAELLDELSEYARWVRGEQTLSRAPTPLRDVLAAAAEAAVLPTAPQVRLELDALAEPTALVDSARLARAWSALITALARAQTGDATLVLALRADAGHAALRLVPHHLLDAATLEKPPAIERAGAGLALAQAALLIERHGGHLAERWVGDVWAGYVCRL